MSLNLINHKLTTSTTDSKGITVWSNPAISVTIDSLGNVFNRSKKLTTKQKYGKYGFHFIENGVKTVTGCSSYNSLFSRMVLGIELGSRTLKLKDSRKGYSENNIEIVSNSKTKSKTSLDTNTIKVNRETTYMDKVSIKYYTLYEAKNEHITEDGAIFPTKELAEWHQNNVSKGKGNAQIVLDYNGGYILAEQIYLQEVTYNKQRPYANFVDVLDNNKGVVSNVQEEHCKFDKLGADVNGMMLVACSVDLHTKSFSKIDAERINTQITKIVESFDMLKEERNKLTKLLDDINQDNKKPN